MSSQCRLAGSRGNAQLSAARIHQHALPVTQAALEGAVTALPLLLYLSMRFGLRDRRADYRGSLLGDGRFVVVFGCGKGGDERLQNCLPGRVGNICSAENRAQAGADCFGLRLSLFRSYVSAAQSSPKCRDGFLGTVAVIPQRGLNLALEDLVVCIENSCEVPVGAVGRGILKNESAALEPRRNRKSDLASRTIGQRMSNCHCTLVLDRSGCPGSFTIRRTMRLIDTAPQRTER
jgi:hypothetical protein